MDPLLTRIAIERAITALNDWTATYASEMCSDEHVGQAYKRIAEQGGTLAYIASVRDQLNHALESTE